MHEQYAQESYDTTQFAKLIKSDMTINQFMADHNFSEVHDHTEVSNDLPSHGVVAYYVDQQCLEYAV